MTMFFNFMLIFVIAVFMFEPFLQLKQIFDFSYDSCCFFVNGIIYFFSKLAIFNACTLKDSQNIFWQSSYLYKSCLFSIPSNVHIVDNKYQQGICSHNFVVRDFSGLCLHSSTFLIKDSGSA